MLFVLPQTSAIRPTSYLPSELYDYYDYSFYPYFDAPQRTSYLPSELCDYSDCGFYSYFDAPQSTLQPHPPPSTFYQPSAEELEELEYQRALKIVADYRRRQVEKEALIHRQRLAEAFGRGYFEVAAETEQQQQEESLAARCPEFDRLLETWPLNMYFSRQSKEPQPVTRQPHVAKRKPLDDALKQRLARESDVDITEPIKNILSSLAPPPAESNKSKDSNEDPSEPVQTLLSSIGKARAVDVEEPQKPAEKPKPVDDAFTDILKHVIELSKSTHTPRPRDKAGPSGSSHSPPHSTEPTPAENEQLQAQRGIALASVEHIRSTLAKLQAEFALPSELDHYTPSTDDRDETASVSSVSSSDLTKLIPYTSTNKPVYKYENELNGLLETLDRIESYGDAEVREKRKEVVKAVEKALEKVEDVVGEVVGKRLSLASAITSPVDELLKGFDVDDSTTEEVTPAQEPAEVLAVDEIAVAPESPVPVETEDTVVVPAVATSPIEETPLAFNDPIVSELPADLETSTVKITPAPLETDSATEPAPEVPQARTDTSDIVDTFLLPEKASPPSPVQKPQQTESDIEDDVISLDSDAEKSDWSEVEQ